MNWKALNQTWHYVEKCAETKPEGEAFIFKNERLQWKNFKEQMDRLAKGFLETGIQIGDRVALISMARNEFPLTYMAANKVGAMWLGLSPKYSLDEFRYMISDSRPKIIFSLREYMDTDLTQTLEQIKDEFSFIKKMVVIGEPIEGTEGYDEFISNPRDQLNEALEKRSEEVKEQDDALLLYTSGSTGKPKGVIHTHQSILSNIRIQNEKFETRPYHKLACPFPINHVASATEHIIPVIMEGCTSYLLDKFDPAEMLNLLESEGISCLGGMPVMFILEMKLSEFATTDFSKVESFIWSGAAAPKPMLDTLQAISRKTDTLMYTGYGSTEMAGFVTYTEKGDDLEILQKSAGKIAAPFELKIVDEERNELPDGKVGEIAVRGPFLMKGYLNKPEETAKVIDKDGWYYSSDLAYKDDRGYIYLTGRKSEMFKTGGENVFPLEIEDILTTHESVFFAAVIGVPDDTFQEVGWAFIMLQPGTSVTEEELKKYCKSRLANFKVPKRFFIREMLPLTPSGKVHKITLKKEIDKIFKQEINMSSGS
ncbi:MAG: AMP-binding protein [Deltaproteobacteria bacterium]|nr:AMP-binding protein [Deltaproteobacteria bacterium]MBW2364511.1 AMP-binding protein [Deltaproteobacteria bacterium]